MSRTTFIILLVIGVLGVFAAFMFFGSNANAAVINAGGAPPYTGVNNAPQGATGTSMPKVVKYGIAVAAPITYVTNSKVIGGAWKKISSIF